MAQTVKIQDGVVVYEAVPVPGPLPDLIPVEQQLDFSIKGTANVTQDVNVGIDPLADGVISSSLDTDLYISPGKNLNLVTDNGVISLNGVTWPLNLPIEPGMFLGAGSTNNLEFFSFVLGVAPSDNMTSAQLEVLFPDAQYGQQVIGPTSLYQKISSGSWRNISALPFTPINKAGDTMTGPLILNADPVNAFGAATKQYVDNVASGLNAHPACDTATTATLASSSGGTVTYNNGVSGVGATLTTTGSFASIGGYSTTNGDRILVKNEASQITNGIYVRTSTTVLTRATDFDDSPDGEIEAGDFTYIKYGTLAGTQWVQITPEPLVGTNNIVFTQLSGAGTYVGGAGINVTSNTITNTGVLSNIAGSNITLSGNTGNVTINLSTNPTINGTNFTNIPNGALINSSVTVGSTNIPLGGTTTTLAGLTSVTATTFNGSFTGNATTATTATSANSLAITNDTVTATSVYPVWSNGISGNQALEVSNTKLSFVPSTGILTATGFSGSGANLTSIPNGALVNSSITIGTTNVSLGGTTTTLSGLTSVTATTFNGTFSGSSTSANSLAIVNDTVTATTVYPVWSNGTSGNQALEVSSTKLSFVPSTGILTATGFSGSGASLTSIPNGALVNSSITIGSTNISLGATSTSLTGLTSVSSAAYTVSDSSNFITFVDSGTTTRGTRGTAGTNDQWFFGGGATASDGGFLEIATGDNGSEPIYVRQYGAGGPPTGTLVRSATLLDNAGNTTFPGTVTADNVTIQNNLFRSVQTGITAAGATLGTATALTKDINVVSIVAASTGVSLEAEVAGRTVIVMNFGANTLNVYPSSASARIDSLALGAAFSLPVGAKIMFICVSATQWYTLNATYS